MKNKLKKINVLFLSAEAAPIAKLGGLGDVAGALPKALASLGIDIRLCLPLYGFIDRKKYHRFNYRKDKLVREGYDENLSEHEIMLNRKIYRIYDSGSLKFNKLFSLKIISQSQDGAKKQSIN